MTDYRAFFSIPAAFILVVLAFYWKLVRVDGPSAESRNRNAERRPAGGDATAV
jgi:hypothetical protein